MKQGRGFTLLELIVVIIILGILATLGLTQYGATIERSRGAEARNILGEMRSLAAVYYFANGSVTNLAASHLNLAVAANDPGIPYTTGVDKCGPSHYFKYDFTVNSSDDVTFTATRCEGTTDPGKNPSVADNSTDAFKLTLTSDFSTGSDAWDAAGTSMY